MLWLHGDGDPRFPFEASRETSRHLADCRFERVEGAGHLLHLECADLVAQRVQAQLVQ